MVLVDVKVLADKEPAEILDEVTIGPLEDKPF
jgi:hypothetical protein